MDKLPIFDALISDEEDGIYAISLVDMPAVERDFLCFNEDKQQKFSVKSEEEQVIFGLIMSADTPIYRRNEDGFEYYIKFSKETIKKMAEKMLSDNTNNNIDLMHNGQILPKGMVELREIFIKDEEKGINPKGFEDTPNGSLFASYKVNNVELWDMCKNGTFKGFSLAGFFDSVRVENRQNKTNTIMSKIKQMLKSMLAQFGMIMTNEGVELNYEGEELVVGLEVKDAEGNPIADGEYTYEDNKIIVNEGIIYSIAPIETEPIVEVEEPEEEEKLEEEEPKVEEEPKEEPKVEEPSEPTIEDIVNELKEEIESIKADIEAIKEKMTEPVVEPIVEEFNKVVKNTTKMSSLINGLNSIKK